MIAMKRMTRRLALSTIALAAALAFVPVGAPRAQSLDAAKSAGLVGERADGYVGIVEPSAPGDIVAMVQNINGKRRAKYQGIAANNGTSLKAVEVIVGEKLIRRAKPGEYVMDSAGRWRRR